MEAFAPCIFLSNEITNWFEPELSIWLEKLFIVNQKFQNENL